MKKTILFAAIGFTLATTAQAEDKMTHQMPVITHIEASSDLIVNAGSHNHNRTKLYTGTEIFWAQLQNKSENTVQQPALGIKTVGQGQIDPNTLIVKLCASNVTNCQNPLNVKFLGEKYSFKEYKNGSAVFQYEKELAPSESSTMTFMQKADDADVSPGEYELQYEAWVLNQ